MRCRVVHLLIKGRYQSQRFKRRGQRGECKEKARGAVPRKSCLGSDLMKVSFPCESMLMGEYVSELHIRRTVGTLHLCPPMLCFIALPITWLLVSLSIFLIFSQTLFFAALCINPCVFHCLIIRIAFSVPGCLPHGFSTLSSFPCLLSAHGVLTHLQHNPWVIQHKPQVLRTCLQVL